MPVTPESVPERVSVRLDEEQRARIAAWMTTNDVEQISTALRSMIDLGAARAEQILDTLSKRMVREGFTHGYSVFLERLAPLLEEMKAETRSK